MNESALVDRIIKRCIKAKLNMQYFINIGSIKNAVYWRNQWYYLLACKVPKAYIDDYLKQVNRAGNQTREMKHYKMYGF